MATTTKKQTVELTTNIGSQDQDKYGLDEYEPEECMEGCLVEVPEAQAKLLIDKGLAKEPTAKSKGRKRETSTVQDEYEEEDEESPVSAESASEAIDEISRMRSKEKLQEIISTDNRVTVVEAAKKQLEKIS